MIKPAALCTARSAIRPGRPALNWAVRYSTRAASASARAKPRTGAGKRKTASRAATHCPIEGKRFARRFPAAVHLCQRYRYQPGNAEGAQLCGALARNESHGNWAPALGQCGNGQVLLRRMHCKCAAGSGCPCSNDQLFPHSECADRDVLPMTETSTSTVLTITAC